MGNWNFDMSILQRLYHREDESAAVFHTQIAYKGLYISDPVVTFKYTKCNIQLS